MPEICFYFNVRQREAALCQLLGKALQQGYRVNIVTDDEAASVNLDRLLWELPSISFLPHCKADHSLAADTPICIDHRRELLTTRDVLFNWGEQLPPVLPGYQRVIEIVDRSEIQRAQARQRFRAYQEQGFTVKSIELAQQASGARVQDSEK